MVRGHTTMVDDDDAMVRMSPFVLIVDDGVDDGHERSSTGTIVCARPLSHDRSPDHNQDAMN